MRPMGRAGGMLLAALLALAVVPGLFITPARGDDAEATYIGDDGCLECHAGFASAWQSSRHNAYLQSDRLSQQQRGCEGCHGPGSKHLEDPDFKSIKNPKRVEGLAAVSSCLTCHGPDVKAPSWLSSEHARAGLSCAACHEVHGDPMGPARLKKPATELCLSCHAEQSAEFKMSSHHPVLEGRMECTSCHNPHASEMGGRLHKSGSDLCLTCHLEKRGPFAFEHQTSLGAGDDGCQACHKPHGSPNSRLQQYFGRGTCLQCHTDIAADAAHQPRGGDCWTAGCHSQFHGSNRNRLFLN